MLYEFHQRNIQSSKSFMCSIFCESAGNPGSSVFLALALAPPPPPEVRFFGGMVTWHEDWLLRPRQDLWNPKSKHLKDFVPSTPIRILFCAEPYWEMTAMSLCRDLCQMIYFVPRHISNGLICAEMKSHVYHFVPRVATAKHKTHGHMLWPSFLWLISASQTGSLLHGGCSCRELSPLFTNRLVPLKPPHDEKSWSNVVPNLLQLMVFCAEKRPRSAQTKATLTVVFLWRLSLSQKEPNQTQVFTKACMLVSMLHKKYQVLQTLFTNWLSKRTNLHKIDKLMMMRCLQIRRCSPLQFRR